MTLAQRNAIIDRIVKWVETEYPPMTTRSMLDVVVAHLAVREGITTTPEEVTRILSQLAEPLA